MLNDDDMSEDEFEGYLSDDGNEERAEDDREGAQDDDMEDMGGEAEEERDHGTGSDTTSTGIPAYTRQEGPTSSLDNLSPVEIFTMIVDNDIQHNLVSHTA